MEKDKQLIPGIVEIVQKHRVKPTEAYRSLQKLRER
jgi:hypothetical protein